MKFKGLYIVFIIAIVLYANFRVIGFLTPRHIMTIILFGACIIEDGRLYWDKYLKWFSLFVVFFGFSSLITGYFSRFLHFLVSDFFVAYVAYWSTVILCVKYNSPIVLIRTAVFLGLLDAAVTICQFYGIGFADEIVNALHLYVSSDFLEITEETDNYLGFALPGIMQSGVYNGYFLMTVAILSLSFQIKKFSIVNLVPWTILTVASYYTQQRSPFFILILLSSFLLFSVVKSSNNKYKLFNELIFVVLLFVGLSFLLKMLLLGESRYALGLADTGRNSIYKNTFAFIGDHFFFGGKYYLIANYSFAPHNLLLNAWVYGGLFGFFFIVILLCLQIIKAAKVIFVRITEANGIFCISAAAWFAFTLNSMVHNASVVSGDVLLWLLWGVVVSESSIIISE